MIERRYELLRQANDLDGPQKKWLPAGIRLPKVRRQKYWGELNDGDSQDQIDRDYFRYKLLERTLPCEAQSSSDYLIVEPVSQANQDGGGAQ